MREGKREGGEREQQYNDQARCVLHNMKYCSLVTHEIL